MPTPQQTSTIRGKSTKICTILQLQSDTHLNAGFTSIIRPIITRLSLHAATVLDCGFMAILSKGKPTGPRIMRELWSNLTDLRERTEYPRRKRTEDILRERGIKTQLPQTVWVAPQDYDVH